MKKVFFIVMAFAIQFSLFSVDVASHTMSIKPDGSRKLHVIVEDTETLAKLEMYLEDGEFNYVLLDPYSTFGFQGDIVDVIYNFEGTESILTVFGLLDSNKAMILHSDDIETFNKLMFSSVGVTIRVFSSRIKNEFYQYSFDLDPFIYEVNNL